MNTIKFNEVSGLTNLVHLRGNLTRDPEVRYFGNGAGVTKFALGLNRSYEVDGVKKEEVSFVDVDYFGNDFNEVGKYLRSGCPVALVGSLVQDKWKTDAGENRQKLLVNGHELREVIFAAKEGQTARPLSGFKPTITFEQLKADGFDSNTVWVVGNLTAKPELVVLPSGKSVADFSIGVRSGPQDNDSSFVEVSTTTDALAKDTANLNKGDQIHLRGSLRQDKWEKDGVKHSKLKVCAFEIAQIEKYVVRNAPPGAQPLPTPRTPHSALASRSM